MAAAQEKEALTDWGPLPFEEPLAVLADELRGRRPQRHRRAHPALGDRAQPADAAAGAGVDPAAPEILDETIAAPIVVVGMMRSGTTLLQRLLAADPRLHCAYGWEVVEAAPRAGLRWSARRRPPHRRRRGARGQIARARAGTVRDPPHVRPRSRGGDRLPGRRVPVARPRVGAHVPRYRSWLDTQDFAPAYRYLHRMLQFLQWQKRQRGSRRAAALGAEDAGAPRLPRHAAGRVPRRARRAHAPRPGRHDPVGRQPQRHAARDALPTTSTRTGWARSGSSGWAGPTTGRWRRATAGPTTPHRSPTSRSSTPSPIRSAGGPGRRRRRAAATGDAESAMRRGSPSDPARRAGRRTAADFGLPTSRSASVRRVQRRFRAVVRHARGAAQMPTIRSQPLSSTNTNWRRSN